MENKEVTNEEYENIISNQTEPIIEMAKIQNNKSIFAYYCKDTQVKYFTAVIGLTHDEVFQNKLKYIDRLNKCNADIIFAEGKPLREAVDTATTIRIHRSTLDSLNSIKIAENESYESTVRRLIMYYRENSHEF